MPVHWRSRRATYVDPETHEKRPERRHAWQKIGPGQIVLFSMIAGIMVVGYFLFQATADKANAQNAALCALRVDLNQRVVETGRFLLKHPNGVPGLASRSDLLTTIHNSNRTLRALEPLEC